MSYPSLRFCSVSLESRDKFTDVAALLLRLVACCPRLRHLRVLAMRVASPTDALSLQESIYALGTLDTLELDCTVPLRTESKFRSEGTRRFSWMRVRLTTSEDFDDLRKELMAGAFPIQPPV